MDKIYDAVLPFGNMVTSVPLTMAGIGGLGPWELIIVLAIVLVVFGAGKVPTVGSSLGEAIKNFRKAVKDSQGSSESQVAKEPKEKS